MELNRIFRITGILIYLLAVVLAIIITIMAIFAPGSIDPVAAQNLDVTLITLWVFITVTTVFGIFGARGPGSLGYEGPASDQPDTRREGPAPAIRPAGEGPASEPPKPQRPKS